MSTTKDLLIEIGTEELPPTALSKLSNAFYNGVKEGLEKADLSFTEIKKYAAPRRLALVINDLQVKQKDKDIERRGPALAAAFDEDGCPSKAAQGFATSCGVEVEDLEKLETDKGAWLNFKSKQKGQKSSELIAEIVQTSLDKLPIAKRMRWADLDAQFVRPVHWLILLFGNDVIDAEILSVKSGRETRGHRFHHPGSITIPSPSEYEMLLETHGKVIADFDRRKEAVRGQVDEIALSKNGTAIIDEDLLEEVAAMVEWPVAVMGNFEKRFLEVPQETLILTMKTNQKYFHLVDKKGTLLPHFITVSNIESKDVSKVQEGNERVIRPRFADAEFFWSQDKKSKLIDRKQQLGNVVFQKQLGTLLDKTNRVSKLAGAIANQLGGDKNLASRAAELCKCDLMSEMVGEFPSLQGTMGRYYAQHDGENIEVASALEEYYKPKFSGDTLPQTITSQSLAIADRLDTLVGIFAIGQTPTGDKDPFALRRAALGVLRISIENKLDLDLLDLIKLAAKQHNASIKAVDAETAVFDFILDRLHAYYLDKGIRPDVLDAVISTKPTKPLDIDNRLLAVDAFRQLDAATSLAAANKRIGNILKKVKAKIADKVDEKFLQEDAEKELNSMLTRLDSKVQNLIDHAKYQDALNELSTLRASVDQFFDDVMVMADDEKLKNNRLALLNKLHNLFLQIADISKLQS
ncbi:MAG: glycine--tRNA ligase subunit beta [Gammaproteobacteria bacterium]|nr:glycine--tRNA ligase subunit beta [Gammaproteobacteria bacterium]